MCCGVRPLSLRTVTRRQKNGRHDLKKHFNCGPSPFRIHPLPDLFSLEILPSTQWPFQEYPESGVFSPFFESCKSSGGSSHPTVFSIFPSMGAFAYRKFLLSPSAAAPPNRSAVEKRKNRDDSDVDHVSTKRQRLAGSKRGQRLRQRNRTIIKSRQKRSARHQVECRRLKVDTLSLGYVNIGLRGLSSRSLEECAMFAEHDNIDFLFISEVKLQAGDISFQRELDGFDIQEFLRPTGNAGGILLMAKDDVNFVYDVWEGDVNPDQSWMSSERVWLRIDHNGLKTAVCGTYVRTSKRRYYEQNQALLDKIEHEKGILDQLGYTCCVIGDLNAHIGSRGRYGIHGNPHGTNTNGHKLISFMDNCNFSVLNNSCLLYTSPSPRDS